jgi:predicted transcriptional regulator
MKKQYRDQVRRYVLQIRLTEEEHDTLTDLSRFLERDKSDIVRDAIAQFIERQTTHKTSADASHPEDHRSLFDKEKLWTA